LEIGGKGVHFGPNHIWDAVALLRRGQVFDCEIIKLPGSEWVCHQNASLLYAGGYAETICTGFALDQPTEMWFQHSFALDAGRPAIIEPGNKTLIRYFGVKLSSTEARRFIAASAVWPMVGVLL